MAVYHACDGVWSQTHKRSEGMAMRQSSTRSHQPQVMSKMSKEKAGSTKLQLTRQSNTCSYSSWVHGVFGM